MTYSRVDGTDSLLGESVTWIWERTSGRRVIKVIEAWRYDPDYGWLRYSPIDPNKLTLVLDRKTDPNKLTLILDRRKQTFPA